MTRSDVVTQEVSGSPACVYAALTDPIALASWLPPDGMSAQVEHFDARPGGGYRMVLRYHDPAASPGKTGEGSDVVEVRFVELVPGERLVEAIDFVSDDDAYAGTMTMTWSITARRGGCLVELRADDVPPGISEADHLEGMRSSLHHLARHLAGHLQH
jgi:uncharacterized protein YndB with AHSA1/START domain